MLLIQLKLRVLFLCSASLIYTSLAAQAAPANDNLAKAQALTGTLGSITGSNVEATQEIDEPDHTSTSGSTSVWYKWTADATRNVTFDTWGSKFDTVMAAYTTTSNPARMASLKSVASNDDGDEGVTSRVSFRAAKGSTYYIAVAGYKQAAGNLTLNWSVAPANDNLAAAATIGGESGSVNSLNRGATLEVNEPLGASSVWYKWKAPATRTYVFNAQSSAFNPILGIHALDTQSLNFANLRMLYLSENGSITFSTTKDTTYYISISGKTSSAVGNFTLKWNVEPPGNDNFANASYLAGDAGQETFNSQGASGEDGEPWHNDASPRRSVWFRRAVSAGETLQFDTSGSNFDTFIAVYSSPKESNGGGKDKFGDLALDATDDDGGSSGASRVRVTAAEATTYYIAVDASGGTGGNGVLNWSVAPQNDDFANAERVGLYTDGVSLFGRNVGASKEFGEPNHVSGNAGGKSVWYFWEAPYSGRATFTTANSPVGTTDFDTQLAAYTGSEVDALALVPGASNDDAGGKTTSSISFNVTKGTTYFIAVDGKASGSTTASGNFILTGSFAFLQPPNDNFVAAIKLEGASGSLYGGNQAATREAGEPRHAGVSGGRSVWFKWTSSIGAPVEFVISQGYDQSLAVYKANGTPAAVNALTNVGGSNNSSVVAFAAAANTTYYIAVEGPSNPEDIDFRLDWLQAPVNDNFASATSISGVSGSVMGTNRGATGETGDPTGSSSIWYRWQAPASGNVTFDSAGSEFNLSLLAYSAGNPNRLENLVQVASNMSGQDTRLAFRATSGVIYYIAVNGQAGNVKLSWYPAPSNDDFARAASLSGNSGSGNFTNVGASREEGEPNHSPWVTPGEISSGRSVWFKWSTTTAGNDARFSTAGSSFDTGMAVYKGSGVNQLSLVAAGRDLDGDGSSTVIFDPIPNQIYIIAVEGIDAGEGTFPLSWSYNPAARPSNDLYAGATVIGGFKGTLLDSNLNAAANESGETVHAGKTGGASIWYEYRSPVTGTVTFDTTGSSINTLLAGYTGTSVVNPPVVASNDDTDANQITSTVSFRVKTGVVYHIVIDGKNAAKGATVLNWSLVPDDLKITSFAPSTGPVGTKVTILGTNLHAVTSVTLNGISIPFTSSGGKLTATVPEQAISGLIEVSGLVDGTPVNSTSSSRFGVTTPIIGSVTPSKAPVGTPVVIEGINFVGASSVDFTGAPVPAADFQVVSDTQIKVKVPEGARSGPLTVNSGSAAISGNFIVIPKLESLNPSSGTINSVVTIRGKSFDNVRGVTFNNKSAPFMIVSPTEIAATVPTGATSGAVKLAYENGQSNSLNFTVTSVIISGFSPANGPKATEVTIRGSNFTATSKVHFNGVEVPATDFKFIDAGRITAKVPATAGTGPISVTTGAVVATSSSPFTVLPNIDNFSPTSGAPSQMVTIKGSNMAGVSRVEFKGVVAKFVVKSSSEITAVVPSGAATGPLKLTISGNAGTGSVTSSSPFTVLPISPTITAISPTGGPVGTVVTITGNGLTGSSAVKFNASAAASFTVGSDSKISATVAAGTTTGKITISTPAGTIDSGSRLFTVSSGTPLTVSGFSPTSGTTGTEVTIKGTGFTGTKGVKFGGVDAPLASIQVVNANQIKVKVPAGAMTGPIAVTSAAGIATSSAGNFTMLPSITNFTPQSGGTGQVVTLTGTNFMGVTRLDFAGTPANFVVNSGSSITATVPAGASSGPLKLTISGSLATTSAASFTVNAPNITSFQPTSGSATTPVTLTGTGFTATSKVKFGNVVVPAADYQFISSTKVVAKVPSGAITAPITLSHEGGLSKTGNFTIEPVINSFSPGKGATGTKVVLSGQSFEGVTAVWFNDIPTSFIIVSPTQIWALVPPNSLTGPINLVHSNSRFNSKTDFVAAPKITSLSPRGAEIGEVVSILGTNLGGVSHVRFNGLTAGAKTSDVSAGSGFEIIDSTRIDVRVPQGATTGPVTVSHESGTPILTAASAGNFLVAPQISTFSPTFGAPGTVVQLSGANLDGATAVTFLGDLETGNDDKKATFSIVSGGQIEVNVPTGAISGPIVIANKFGGNPSITSFIVAPRIGSFSPTTGGAGTSVVVRGSNFQGTNKVSFNGLAASNFTVNSAGTQITVVVPPGSTTGKIVVTTPAGSTTSSGTFTVSTTLQSGSAQPPSVNSS